MSTCPTVTGPAAAVSQVQGMITDLQGWINDTSEALDDAITSLTATADAALGGGGAGSGQGLDNQAGAFSLESLRTPTSNAVDTINSTSLAPMAVVPEPDWSDELRNLDIQTGANLSADPTVANGNVAEFSTNAVPPVFTTVEPVLDVSGIPTQHYTDITLPDSVDLTVTTTPPPEIGGDSVPDAYQDDETYKDPPNDPPEKPDIMVDALPTPLNTEELSVADPTLEDPVVPDEPDDTLPIQPELIDYTDQIPEAPVLAEITYPEWTPPTRPEVPEFLFEWTSDYANLNSGSNSSVSGGVLTMGAAAAQMDYIRAYLAGVRGGDPFTLYTLPESVIDQAFAKGRDQTQELISDEIDVAVADYAGRRIYGPSVRAAVSRITERGHQKVLDLSRDLAIEQARNGLKEFELAITHAVDAEKIFVQEYGRMNAQAYDAAKYAVDFSLKSFDLQLAILKFDYDDQRFELERVNQILQTQSLELQKYEVEIRALNQLGQLNQQQLESYRTAIAGVTATFDLYEKKFTEGRFRLEQNTQALQIQAQEIDAQKLKIEAKRLEYTGFDSTLKGEGLKLDKFGAEMSGFQTRTQAWATESEQTNKTRDIGIKTKGLEIDSYKLLQTNDELAIKLFAEERLEKQEDVGLKLQQFGIESDNVFKTDRANLDAKGQEYQAHGQKLDGERIKSENYRIAASSFASLVDAFKAETDVDIAKHNLELKEKIELPLATYSEEWKYAAKKLDVLLGEARNKTEARRSDVDMFEAKVNQNKALSEDNTTKFTAADAASDREIQRRLQQLAIEINDANTRMQVLVSANEAVMQAIASMYSGLTSAYNATASMGSTATDGTSNTCTTSYNYSGSIA